MPYYSKSSKDKLASCADSLIALFSSVIQFYDNKIIQGRRTLEEHKQNLANGKTKAEHSKHVMAISEAVDASPYPVPKDWGSLDEVLKGLAPYDRKRITDIIKERAKFYHFAGYVQGHADLLGTPVRWGGDWDSDKDFSDQTFDDLVHFETK